jgi:glycosyltransferase involved in cell wall biosynthesis
MRKPRVLQVVLSLSPGGTERLVVELCRHLRGRIDMVVCCLDERGAWAAELDAAGVPVVVLGRQPGFQPGLARQIAAVIRTHRIDVVHCHHYTPYVYGLLASLLTRVPLVFTEHGRLSDARPSRKRRIVNPWLARLGGQIYAVSADLKQHMIAEGFPEPSVDVIYNGIDTGSSPDAAHKRAARAALGLAADAFVVGTAGRLDPVKNLGELLEAHALLRAQVPQAHAVIIGDGAERAALEQRAAALGVTDAVTFAGYRADVRALMAAFDVYVNCSTYEGVSLTILEAMATSLPVIATAVGGNPEVVIDHVTGVLTPGQPRAIADAMVLLACEPELRQELGETGRRRVLRQFSIGRMVDAYAEIYSAARNQRTAPAPSSDPAAADAMSVNDATRSVV